MFLLGTQSAFFGPAKYGVIPELVGESKISMANALINMLTNVAAILSVVVGGKLIVLQQVLATDFGIDPVGPSYSFEDHEVERIGAAFRQ